MEKKKVLGIGLAMIAATSMLAACGTTEKVEENETGFSTSVDTAETSEGVSKVEGSLSVENFESAEGVEVVNSDENVSSDVEE
jgi:3,4-dihydroxy-2-butanone 4-phosphate synthase